MPESIIIAPEKEEAAGIDLDLFLRVTPSVRVGDRIVSLVGIEHVEYQEVVAGDGETDNGTTIQLGISYQSGSIYFFDDQEEMELEKVLKAAIQKSEEQAKQQMNLQVENQMLKQELAHVVAQGVKTGKIVPPWGNKRH
jgi:hypothetical protein